MKDTGLENLDFDAVPSENKEDHVMPTDKWTFDEEVTNVFDNMLERSIPQYDIMRELCFQYANAFIIEKTDVLDIGCSRGEAIKKLIDKHGAHNRYIGVDVSKPMINAAIERFKGYINNSIVDIHYCDLRTDFPNVNASIVLAVLTIQFTPIEYRQQIIHNVYKAICNNGAFILVEKIIGASHPIDKEMNKQYYQMKAQHGYSQEEIERKKLALEGVLVPLSHDMNIQLLKNAGFKFIDSFWRWNNFEGFIAIK